jgi:2-keto-4-pentenoate hydratase/2-oxohepta-3-ene-1,7-dioic acid hydratase in catechol pathway
MKLVRYGAKGKEKPGLIDADGVLRDLSRRVKMIDADSLSPAGLAKLKKLAKGKLAPVKGKPRMGVPWEGIGKVICIGLNYSDHAKETGSPIPSEPVVFMKPNSALNGPNDNVIVPKGSEKTDWEVELGVVIGRKASHVEEKDALKYVAGYCVCNDVSERHYQMERDGGRQWIKGKGCDTFCPTGPWLVTADEVKDPQNLAMWLEVNGVRRQNGTTQTMIFGVAHLVSYMSRFMTLYPGDLILTGTPPGVGLGMKPPLFLKAGDVVRVGIAGLGEQTQKMVAWPGK